MCHPSSNHIFIADWNNIELCLFLFITDLKIYFFSLFSLSLKTKLFLKMPLGPSAPRMNSDEYSSPEEEMHLHFFLLLVKEIIFSFIILIFSLLSICSFIDKSKFLLSIVKYCWSTLIDDRSCLKFWFLTLID